MRNPNPEELDKIDALIEKQRVLSTKARLVLNKTFRALQIPRAKFPYERLSVMSNRAVVVTGMQDQQVVLEDYTLTEEQYNEYAKLITEAAEIDEELAEEMLDLRKRCGIIHSRTTLDWQADIWRDRHGQPAVNEEDSS